MIIYKVVTYTPFMAGLKYYCNYTSTDPDTHMAFVNRIDHCGHLAGQALPKAMTCPHWLRAWTALVCWKGEEILQSDIAKSFLDMEYELTPKLIEQLGGAEAKWIAQIHLEGTYNIIQE